MNRGKLSIISVLTLLLMVPLAFGSGQKEPAAAGGKVTITYWSWGESDIPGFDKWLAAQVAKYESANPGVTVNVVTQNTDTLTGAFQATAQTNSGPDLATLWATIPVLTQAWASYLAPLNDYVSQSEMDHWLNTSENVYNGKVWAMPIYLIGVPLVYNKDMFAKAGLDPNNPPSTWQQFLAACAQLKAHGITPLGMGNKDGYTGTGCSRSLASSS